MKRILVLLIIFSNIAFSEIVLDKSTLKEIDAKIQKKFGIERLKNF